MGSIYTNRLFQVNDQVKVVLVLPEEDIIGKAVRIRAAVEML